MSCSSKARKSSLRSGFAAVAVLAATLGGCTWQPLHAGDGSVSTSAVNASLAQIYVSEVDTRVAQQVRNHLIFLLQGGRDDASVPYTVRLRVTSSNLLGAAVKDVRDFTAGAVTVNVSYELVEAATGRRIAAGNRMATASYDRTSQSFANNRAVRDAENRAAQEAAERLRLALAANLAG